MKSKLPLIFHHRFNLSLKSALKFPDLIEPIVRVDAGAVPPMEIETLRVILGAII